MATVDIRGLQKAYGNNLVLPGLDIEVGDGELLTLLGPSGCGKTTTLRCLAGLERADAGSITIGGEVVADPGRKVFVPPNRRDIGMVFQSYALWPHMTVFANVGYPLRLRRPAGVDRRTRVMEILEIVGMDAYAQRHVTELSGGQQQRVALARAMVASPGLLLFDEPLSNLDAKLRRTMRREIRAAHDASAATSVYVTHDQEEAVVLSDRVVVLHEGAVQQVGTPRDIYQVPANRFVADFVGFDNILRGEVRDRVGQAQGVGLDGVGAPAWSELGATLPDGADALVAVRAEYLDIAPRAGATAGHPSGVDGVVRTCTFTGQHVEYVVDVGSQKLLVRVDEMAVGADALPSGAPVTVRFDPARTVVLAAERELAPDPPPIGRGRPAENSHASDTTEFEHAK